MSDISIDPTVQSFLDRHLTIARATFGKDKDDKTLIHTALTTFAGMGLVELAPATNGLTWVPTDRFIEVTKYPPIPVDLTPFMTGLKEQPNEPKVTGSLRLIIEEIARIKRQQEPEPNNPIGFDGVLTALAWSGRVSFRECDGEFVWMANLELIDHFESIKAEVFNRQSSQKSEILLDDLLKTVTDQFHKMLKRRIGNQLTKRTTIISFLIVHELAGDVIAYKDKEGRLAWKATPELRRWFEDE